MTRPMRKGATITKIRELLAEGPCTIEKLRSLGLPKATVYYDIKRLLEVGEIKELSGHRYSLVSTPSNRNGFWYCDSCHVVTYHAPDHPYGSSSNCMVCGGGDMQQV
jgi:hypothetical protein